MRGEWEVAPDYRYKSVPTSLPEVKGRLVTDGRGETGEVGGRGG